MKLISHLRDGRIEADNFLFEICIGEYLAIASAVLNNNEFQRRRVKSSPTIYSLLKEDVMRGCVLPSMVLAFADGVTTTLPPDQVGAFLQQNADRLLILDGLQRTSSLLDLHQELTKNGETAKLAQLNKHTLRVEFYIGISRIGVLYRMLTLNTGQTPMSLRQQVEILFLDYAKIPLAGIRLIKEIDDESPTELGEYPFKSVVDGFNSYLERNELPIDRYDLLESIKSLEKLGKEDEKKNLFEDFIKTYDELVRAIDALSNGNEFTSNELGIQGQPFARHARRIFSREQSMAGFGAAVAKLRDYKLISSFDDIKESVRHLTSGTPSTEAFSMLLRRLEDIRIKSKKLGNAQRMYFQFYFRELFNPNGDSYRNLLTAVDAAYQKYESQTM